MWRSAWRHTTTQSGCNVSLQSDEDIEFDLPPRSGVIKGNQLQGQGTGQFAFQMPGGPTLKFSKNTATYQGTITGNTITLSGSGSASGKACNEGHRVDFSCTGTSTARLHDKGLQVSALVAHGSLTKTIASADDKFTILLTFMCSHTTLLTLAKV